MGIFRSIGRGISSTVKSCVDVKGWIGYNNIKSQTRTLTGLGKAIFSVRQKKIVAETKDFDEVLKQKNISEEDLKKRENMYFRRAGIFVVVGLLGLMYMVYAFYAISFLGGIIVLLVTGFVFLQAFGMSLYYVQIKNRTLRISIKGWFRGIVGGGQ